MIHISFLKFFLTALYPSLVSTASIVLGLQSIIYQTSCAEHLKSDMTNIFRCHRQTSSLSPIAATFLSLLVLSVKVRCEYPKHTVLNSYFKSTYHTSKLIFWLLTKQAANCLHVHVTTLLMQRLVLTTSYKPTLHTKTPQSKEFYCCGIFCSINKIIPCKTDSSCSQIYYT